VCSFGAMCTGAICCPGPTACRCQRLAVGPQSEPVRRTRSARETPCGPPARPDRWSVDGSRVPHTACSGQARSPPRRAVERRRQGPSGAGRCRAPDNLHRYWGRDRRRRRTSHRADIGTRRARVCARHRSLQTGRSQVLQGVPPSHGRRRRRDSLLRHLARHPHTTRHPVDRPRQVDPTRLQVGPLAAQPPRPVPRLVRARRARRRHPRLSPRAVRVLAARRLARRADLATLAALKTIFARWSPASARSPASWPWSRRAGSGCSDGRGRGEPTARGPATRAKCDLSAPR
jgi:hypothetical protein